MFGEDAVEFRQVPVVAVVVVSTTATHCLRYIGTNLNLRTTGATVFDVSQDTTPRQAILFILERARFLATVPKHLLDEHFTALRDAKLQLLLAHGTDSFPKKLFGNKTFAIAYIYRIRVTYTHTYKRGNYSDNTNFNSILKRNELT